MTDLMKTRPTSPTNLEAIIELATKGNPLAQFRLGEIYADPWDIHEDLEQSVRCYRKAAEQGFANAYSRLATQLRHVAHQKAGVASEAIKWLREAALGGCYQSAFWLSNMYCLNLQCRIDVKHKSGITIPSHWSKEISQSALQSYIWLNVSEELKHPDHGNDQHTQEMYDELVSRLTPDDLSAAHKSITAIHTEVNWHKNVAPVNDDLEPENELLRVDPEDFVEYASQDEWDEIVRQHDASQ